jgi:hypothetical protein
MPTELGITWLIESIRITGFLRTSPKARYLEEWLEKISENVPIQVTKTNTSFSGVAKTSNGFLRMDFGANRLDTLLLPDDPESNNTVGDFGSINELFAKYVERFPEIMNFPIFDRLAVGLVLTCNVENEANGLERLKLAINGLSLDSRVHDFQYRSNIPYSCASIEGFSINRLATWSVGQVQTIQVKIGSDASQIQEIVRLAPIAIRLELDINTDKDLKIGADSEKTKLLLGEYKTQALKLATFGEKAMLE